MPLVLAQKLAQLLVVGLQSAVTGKGLLTVLFNLPLPATQHLLSQVQLASHLSEALACRYFRYLARNS